MKSVVKNFLRENDENKKLYVEGIVLKDLKALDKLENKFNDYLFKTYLCSYIKKSIQFASMKIKKKGNNVTNRERLCLNVLDVNFQEERVNSIPDKKMDILYNLYELKENIDYTQVFCNEKLSKSFNKLTNKEKKVINECVMKDKAQVDVAKALGISRQAVSKVKKTALKKLREELKGA